jgi:hypothetical protein
VERECGTSWKSACGKENGNESERESGRTRCPGAEHGLMVVVGRAGEKEEDVGNGGRERMAKMQKR